MVAQHNLRVGGFYKVTKRKSILRVINWKHNLLPKPGTVVYIREIRDDPELAFPITIADVVTGHPYSCKRTDLDLLKVDIWHVIPPEQKNMTVGDSLIVTLEYELVLDDKKITLKQPIHIEADRAVTLNCRRMRKIILVE